MSEPSFSSESIIIFLAILFLAVGVVASLIYYFARYYVKTDQDDKELLTKKPIAIGIEPGPLQVSQPGAIISKTLNESLVSSRQNIWGRLSNLFKGEMDHHLLDEVEEILYTSDLGPQTAEVLLAKVSASLSGEELNRTEIVRLKLRHEMLSMLEPSFNFKLPFEKKENLQVWMIVGVNGAGKTTTIGKLASFAKQKGLKVLIVAGDTFRAAADSQLKSWAERAQCEIYMPGEVKDPSAVTYAALEKAKKESFNLVIVDTAGRLHTQEHLMEELKKTKRVMAKVDTLAPHATLLILDANAGQNALEQARQFHAALGLTGIILTKLDGSSRAGVAIGVSHELKLPISHIGVGESVDDLRLFDPQAFVEAII